MDIKTFKKEKGFTLIETLIYIAIIGLVVSGFVVFAISVSDSRNKAYVISEVQANCRIAMDVISQRIKSAANVNIAESYFGGDPGVLSLSMKDGLKNPTIINLNEDDGILQIIEGSADPMAITSDEVKVTDLVFTNLTGENERENIRIEITIVYNNAGTDIKYNYSQSMRTAVSLRQ